MTIINTSAPELVQLLLGNDVRIENFEDLSLLGLRYGPECIAGIRTIRDVNYSIPTHIPALPCGSLNIPVAPISALDAFRLELGQKFEPYRSRLNLSSTNYCIVHLEITRKDYAGRGPGADKCSMIFEVLSEYFAEIIVIGLEKQWVIPSNLSRSARISDCRGKFSLLETMAVISKAQFFVGVDSMPAHVAQAFGVKCALLFGSVHPLAWVWDQQRVWPITAPLSCIGCYQMHLEPSVPFCMRRDEACMSQLPEAAVRSQIEAMVSGTLFDWSALTARFRDLQAMFYRYLRYHPAPPEKTFRRQTSSNEKIGNLIFEMTDRMADMVSGHYETVAVTTLRSRISELERDLQQSRTIAREARGVNQMPEMIGRLKQ